MGVIVLAENGETSVTTFNTTASANKTSFAVGETITVSISGDATGPDVTQNLNVTLNLEAADGSVGTASVVVPFTRPGDSLAVVITSVTDNGGRVWTVAGNGKSASAVV